MIARSPIHRPPPPRCDWPRARLAQNQVNTARRRGGAPSSSSPVVVALARASSTDAPDQQQQEQVVLDAVSALAYAREHLPNLFLEGDADDERAAASAEPLNGGVINSVFAVRCQKSRPSIVLKQALPHVRAVGPSFPLSRARMDAEAAAMALAERAATVASAAVEEKGKGAASSSSAARPPALLRFDRAQSVLVCARVPEPAFTPLYDALVAGRLPAGPVAAPLFRLLARLQRPRAHGGGGRAGAADAAADASAAASLKNDGMVRANLDVVLRQPFGIAQGGDPAAAAVDAAPPHLRADAERLLLSEPPVRRAAQALDAHYARSAARSSHRFRGLAFAHNDLHPANVFVPTVPAEQGAAALFPDAAEEEGGEEAAAGAGQQQRQQQQQPPPPFLIDWEFAAPGPAEFDVGTLCGNLLVAALALPLLPLPLPLPPPTEPGPTPPPRAVRAAQRAWLLAEAAGAWRAHEAAAREALGDDEEEEEQEQERWAVAWAGAAIVRQMIGIHRHPLLRLASAAPGATSSAEFEAAERSCLALGRAMLLAAPDDAAEERRGRIASFGAAAAVCLELARTHEDLYGGGES